MVGWKHFIAADGKVILHSSLEIPELRESSASRSQRGLLGEHQEQEKKI